MKSRLCRATVRDIATLQKWRIIQDLCESLVIIGTFLHTYVLFCRKEIIIALKLIICGDLCGIM